MLSPRSDRVVLLPQDRQIIEALGLTEDEYREYVRYCSDQSRIQPSGPQAFLIVPFLITLVIGLILNVIAAALITPRNNTKQANSRETQIRQSSQQGIQTVENSEFAPKAGFDGIQKVVELGSTIPLVYARRLGNSGGIRINTPLLWSQLWSVGGSQILRAIFMIAEATIASLDKDGFAIGDNTVNNFAFLNSPAATTGSKLTIYWDPDGGRIKGTSYVGRLATNDPANAQNAGAADVFQTRAVDNTFVPWFSNVSTPSTTKDFGVYTLIPNNMGLRLNPALSPNTSFQLRNIYDNPKTPYEASLKWGRNYPDTGGIPKFWKEGFMYSGRSGITATSTGSNTLSAGDTFTYVLDASSDELTKFTCVDPNDKSSPPNIGEEPCNDIASMVASRQKTADDALSIGDVFKAGSCLAVLESRTPADSIFVSTASTTGPGQSITCTFRVVRAGRVSIIDPGSLSPNFGTIAISGNISASGPAAIVPSPPRFGIATTAAQIFKFAVGGFTIDRAARVIEIGLRSRLGIQVGGICDFRSALSQEQINARAGTRYEGAAYDNASDVVTLQQVTTGSVTMPLTRYSFFRISYRKESDTNWTDVAEIFGARSQTQQNVFNYMRFVMPSEQRWEYRMEALTSWEIRNVLPNATLNVLDNRIAGIKTTVTSGVTIYWTGEAVARAASSFRLEQIESTAAYGNLGLGYTEGDSFFDTWGAIAEAYVYQEISTTSSGGPEHSICYVNTIIENKVTPNYDNLSIIGLNMYASDEFRQLEQFSCYVTGGQTVKRLVDGVVGPTNNFADVLLDMLTNERYGMGRILSPKMVDVDSFTAAAKWIEGRKYTYDGATTSQLNVRSWAASTASYFLQDFLIANGRFSLQPGYYFNEVVPITGIFTSGNIIEGSFGFKYAEQTQRQPVQVSVKWREERLSTQQGSKGLFPTVREVLVREVGTAQTAPLETVDMSDFCTTQAHAIEVAKSIVRTKRLVTNSVSFSTTPSEASLRPGSFFKLGLEALSYAQPNNGAITIDGAVSSFIPLMDGKYTALVWDGKTNTIPEVELDIVDGKCLAHAGSVFCIKDSVLTSQTYKVQSLSFNEDGNIDVEASLYPCDDAGYSLITKDWDTGWEILQ